MIKDGEVIERKVHSLDSPRLQFVEHIAKVSDKELHGLGTCETGCYVTRKELVPLVTEAVVAGVNAAIGRRTQAPVTFKAQEVVADRVDAKKKMDTIIVGVLGIVLFAQAIFLGYVLLV